MFARLSLEKQAAPSWRHDSGGWIRSCAAPRLNFLLMLIIAVSGCLPKTTATVAKTDAQSEAYVKYEMAGVSIRYYLMENGFICSGTIRNGKHIVWGDAKPLSKSEYMYGGENYRMPLIQLKNIEYQSEQSPDGLNRIIIPKE
jgi:hypothetical protein